VNARVFQHDQCKELAAMMAQRYKDARNPEPICLIGHSFGSDDTLIISRELDKAGVPVDLVVTMDPVDERTVPKNVKMCYNYWMPGIFVGTNFLRGVPLQQEPGAIGRLENVNLNREGRELRNLDTNHINIDECHKLHQRIIEHVLATCPDRRAWLAMHPEKQPNPPRPPASSDMAARNPTDAVEPIRAGVPGRSGP
jgi:hypothetical protein